jgi:hypothetical protein
MIVAIPDKQKTKNYAAVNVLAHTKSPRANAQGRLRTDVRAQIPDTLQVDMPAILSGWKQRYKTENERPQQSDLLRPLDVKARVRKGLELRVPLAKETWQRLIEARESSI